MTSVGPPSIALWQGMQSRASCLPALMQEAFEDEALLAGQRVHACLRQLSALASLAQACRLSLYCRECSKLLTLCAQHSARRRTLEPLLLLAAVRVAQSLESPLSCLIDRANLDELRRARGASAMAQTRNENSTAWAVPNLKALLCKRLRSAHYRLGDCAEYAEPHSAPSQSNSFLSLNRVAALWLGKTVLENVENSRRFQQTCMQILRLELCCHEASAGAPPRTFGDLRVRFLEVSKQQLLSGLRRQIRELIKAGTQQEGMHLARSLWVFQKVDVCCTLLDSRQAMALKRIGVSAQQLALHLRCWAIREREAQTLLYLCALALERHLDIAIVVQQGRQSRDRADIRLRRKVQHFIRTHRRRLRAEYGVPVRRARAIAYTEVQQIHRVFCASLKLYKKTGSRMSVEDDFFHALIRCKSISVYMGEMALYEVLFNLREMAVLAIERRLILTRALFGLLPRLTAYCLRSLKQGGRVLGYDTRLIGALSEVLRAHRQNMLSRVAVRDRQINMPSLKGQNDRREGHSIATTQLPSYLANNIRSVITDPEAIYRCKSVQEFAELSRGTILELNLLARGALALRVDRVAALSEVLLEIYRSVNALTQLPQQGSLQCNLRKAHRCLRLALNQAAARQTVCEVRPTIIALYRFLECLHRAPAHAPDSVQAALRAVNSLAVDMRVFADLFVSAIDPSRATRAQLAQDQLQGLLSATRRLQEDLSANAMVDLARWVPSLTYTVGRHSNECGKPVRLQVHLDGIEAPRGLVDRLQVSLQSLLRLMIEHSVEAVPRRRDAGKSDSASLQVRAERSGARLEVILTDDGEGLSASQVASVTEQIVAHGGALALASEATDGSVVCVSVDCASLRWDIASKSL